jgi:hypothetical protein
MRSFFARCFDAIIGLYSRVMDWFTGETDAEHEAGNEVGGLYRKIKPLAADIIKKYPVEYLKEDIQRFSGISLDLLYLLEILCHQAEALEDKSGPEKKEFVIAVVLRLYHEHLLLDLPVPEVLAEPAIRLGVGAVIDGLVQVLNRNGIFKHSPETRSVAEIPPVPHETGRRSRPAKS